ncbi:MAG TPA: glycoside hydrolase family 3, partial [Micromonospora sp.]
MRKSLVATAIIAAALVATALSTPPAARAEPTPPPGPTAPPAAEPGWVVSTLRHMTLEQKVGQLFVTYLYGADATAPAPGDRAANRAAFGVETPAEVVERYHLGGVV